jgi:hypothetical protein
LPEAIRHVGVQFNRYFSASSLGLDDNRQANPLAASVWRHHSLIVYKLIFYTPIIYAQIIYTHIIAATARYSSLLPAIQ